MENEERNMFIFIWKVENWSYTWQEVNECILSPPFQICQIEGSSWCLRLYPRGIFSFINFVSLYLQRLPILQGPMYSSVDYELSFLRSDGAPEYTAGEKGCVFLHGQYCGFPNLVSREEILHTKKSIILPNDTLTMQCRICLENIGLPTQIQAFAKSIVQIHRDLFLWNTGEFNYVFPNGPGCSSKLNLQRGELSLKINEDSLLASLKINFDRSRMYRFRMGILDSKSSTSQFLVDEYMFNRETQSITAFLIKRSKLLQRKELYLPQGRLILHCEFTCSSQYFMGHIESRAYDNIFKIYPSDERENNYSSMKSDFQNLYQEGTLCDFTIKVGNEYLQVHKAVLCARSPVFKAMLTSNMSENEKNMVDIGDLEMDTVRRMLTFMYTDTTDGLSWETANKLYFAADKYDIAALRQICAEFLKINLSVANVQDVLTLADIHSDEDLNNVALKFIQSFQNREITWLV